MYSYLQFSVRKEKERDRRHGKKSSIEILTYEFAVDFGENGPQKPHRASTDTIGSPNRCFDFNALGCLVEAFQYTVRGVSTCGRSLVGNKTYAHWASMLSVIIIDIHPNILAEHVRLWISMQDIMLFVLTVKKVIVLQDRYCSEQVICGAQFPQYWWPWQDPDRTLV